MSKDYNTQVAFHYSKYRPPLHDTILSKALNQKNQFNCGLDIGCGTGKSTKSLSKFCSNVVGLDPSKSMIDNAEIHSSITYVIGDENVLSQFQSKLFDIVAFAGSLYYAKNEKLRTELKRICSANAVIIIYDFEVLLGILLSSNGLMLSNLSDTNYDHSINITDWSEFKTEVVFSEQIKITLNVEELAHFILAHSTWHDELVVMFDDHEPFDKLVNYLKSKDDKFQLPVNIFYSAYTIK